jgi:hypothetical protein
MIDTVKEWWGAIVTAATVVAGLAVGEYRIRKNEERITELETSGKRRLYDEDGRQIYVMRSECSERLAECRDSTCRKIDDLRDALKASDARRATHEAETTRILLDLTEKIGRVAR